jgi:hypothetical protein
MYLLFSHNLLDFEKLMVLVNMRVLAWDGS